MTGLEDSIKGKTFFKTKNGEYQELGTLKSIRIESKKEEEYMNIMTDTEEEYMNIMTDTEEEYMNIMTDTEAEFEFEIKNKGTIRKLKKLIKTDKDKKAERRFNKNSFRNFIKNI